MKKEIEIQQTKVEYTLKTTRRSRRMRLAIYCDGNFVVTAPSGASESLIERFIIEKSEWIINKLEYFKNFKGIIFPRETKGDFLQYKQLARNIAQERALYFNRHYGFTFNRITIKKQKTRWGSCSKQGNLNFNYKIALLSSQLADYIIVHELCHLGEFNHSQKFWNLVAETIPDYIQLRKELKSIRMC